MTLDELKARKEQVQNALTQNHFTLQGHMNEIDFQIAELSKAKEAELAAYKDSSQPEQLVAAQD